MSMYLISRRGPPGPSTYMLLCFFLVSSNQQNLHISEESGGQQCREFRIRGAVDWWAGWD